MSQADPHVPGVVEPTVLPVTEQVKVVAPTEKLRDAVAKLHADLTALADEHKFEISKLRTFGLEFDVFDPVTGTLISPARAHRRDVGDLGALMTPEAVISDLAAGRRHQAAVM